MPSTAAGFLVPTLVVAEPINDEAFEDLIQATIVGILGRIPPSLVRPRWQPNPPNQPDLDTNWVAFGIVHSEPDVYAAEIQAEVPGAPATIMHHVVRTIRVNVLLSFYGPQSSANEATLRAGLSIGQNRDILLDNNVAVVELQGPTIVPALLKQTWVRRVDSMLILNRAIDHVYEVQSVAGMGAGAGLNNEQYVTSLNINSPAAP